MCRSAPARRDDPVGLLQQLAQFVAADAGGLEDAEEEAGLDVAVVDRDHNRVSSFGMDEVVVAAACAAVLPALGFEDADQPLRLDRGELSLTQLRRRRARGGLSGPASPRRA
jgi:hypothetical protein